MQHVIDFVLELDKLKRVTRKTRPTGLDRYENTAEHSWQIALLAASLVPYAETGIDSDRVIQMLLVHDVGEIDTGDTIFYADEGLSDRKAAERVAVTRIFGHLPEPQRSQLLSLWEEFDEGTTAEAKFAHAADRAMPVILNLANDGQSWRENGIAYERVIARVGPPIRNGCPALWEYLEAQLEERHQKGWFGQT
jgi:putative hydrolase of HD superfamily